MNLYQISAEHRNLIDALIENGGELTEELASALQISEKQIYSKGESYAMVIKEKSSEVDIIDAEIERLTKLKKSRQNTIEYLKKTVLDAMRFTEIEKIETPVLKISIRESESVEVVNQEQLSREFLTEKVTYSPDKKAIKEAIKSGETVYGAVLKTNYSLQIK